MSQISDTQTRLARNEADQDPSSPSASELDVRMNGNDHHVNFRDGRSDRDHQDRKFADKAGLRRGKTTKKLRFASMKVHPERRASMIAKRVSEKIPIIKPLLDLPEDEEISRRPRTLYVNQSLSDEDLDSETGYPKAQYARNKIRTTKYTPLSFFPKNIYFQFHNLANIYFLFIVILSAFPIFGVANPGLAAVPIIAIVIITAIKDAIEDYRRTLLDSEVNNTITCKLVHFDNPNVVEENISLWRKFKKACTRGAKASWKWMKSRLGKQKKNKVSEKDPFADVELRSVTTAGSLGDDISSVYDRQFGASSINVASNVSSNVSSGQLPITKNISGSQSVTNDTYNKIGTVIDRSHDVPGKAKFRQDYWKNLKCGDIVKVFENEEVPSDMVVLSTSDADGACYIETKNLDGETNLKVRQSLRATSNIKHSRDLEQSSFRVKCEAPNPALYTFNGVLQWEQRRDRNSPVSEYEDRSEAVSINNLLLRGSALRNTKWVIGLVVYTGAETKIMLNSGATPAKRSRLIRDLNYNVIYNFVFLFVLAFIAGVVNGIYFRKKNSSATYFEFGSIGGSPAVDGLVTFWAAVILLQNLIPISLYISIEIVKTVQAFFIYSDLDMYYAPLDYPCTPKSWSISDDVGQVEYIFSDKTGTLTQNVMEFKKCTINGVSYGKAFTEATLGILKQTMSESAVVQEAIKTRQAIEDDKKLMLSSLRTLYDNPYLFDDDVSFVSSDVVNALAGKSSAAQNSAVDTFFLALALCHTVIPERTGPKQDRLIFKAQSPDEAALVATARDVGYSLVERTRNGVVLNIEGKIVQYDILCVLEFNSTRKRMSVIVKMQDGRIMLICKGADSVIYSRLSPQSDAQVKQDTSKQLEEYANEGLRTLCLAEKELRPEEYEEWAKRHDEASSAIYDREEKMEQCADEIERNLHLLGGTAIEDRLQDGVPDAIALLGRAGVKVWVLTGDKVATAINIGYSCNLLESGMDLMIIKDEKPDEISGLITQHLSEKFNLQGTEEELAQAKQDHSPPGPRYGLVIDGGGLESILKDPELIRKFVILAKQCKSVLCCRVSPAQKAAVVRCVKQSLDVTTLAIGDGANDVAMIQEADVGVGIAGLEGRQAVMTSDYAIAQFRFLRKLVLVHGRWSYNRLSELTANLFYKNVVFTMTLFWFDVHNSFDGSYLFDYTYITLFNLAFTSLPVIFMGFLDQDVEADVMYKVPQLYQRGILRLQWTQLKFWIYVADGLYQSAVCYFFSFCVFYNGTFVNMNGLQVNQLSSYGVFTATAAIICCNFYVMMNEYRWDWVFLLVVAISIMLVFFWTGIYTQFVASRFFYKVASQIYSSIPFWANMLLQIVTCLLPRFTCKAYQKMFLPYDVDIVREEVRDPHSDLYSLSGDQDDKMNPQMVNELEHTATVQSGISWRRSLDRIEK